MHELTRDPHVRHTWGKTPDKKELYCVTACSVGTFRTGQGGWYWKKAEQWSALLGDGGGRHRKEPSGIDLSGEHIRIKKSSCWICKLDTVHTLYSVNVLP